MRCIDADKLYPDCLTKTGRGAISQRQIAEAQTIQPNRQTGEWIVQRLHNGVDDVYCPFCNARPRRSDYGYYIRDKFCHECGADLRVKEKKND